ncbi:MAG: cupin domain-containing protein [Bacteroidetes bacterium]|nr:cupin domain-containing protein [Bacteroidota bacterium]MDA1119220.1 cupin domain-containing protein [Bacteroidota bacterium]
MSVSAQEIPIEYLTMQLGPDEQQYSNTILENEIAGVSIEHFILTGNVVKKESRPKGYKTIYLFINGRGDVIIDTKNYDIIPEAILLPNAVQEISITAVKNDTLHYLKITSALTEQDIVDLDQFPEENTQKAYFTNFSDCEAYTEEIKSLKTVSRTVLPNKYIPRMAMGTVETAGPDKVSPHEHPMLEQLFLGLSGNHAVVHADGAHVDFPAYSILHIPLGSNHSVEAGKGDKMHYLWMDFFLDKKGEE